MADALARAMQAAGIQVIREVTVEGKLRPADLLLRRRRAVEITVGPPITHFDKNSPCSFLTEAEKCKHTRSDAAC